MREVRIATGILIVVGLASISGVGAPPASGPAGPKVECYRLKMPDGRADIEQASGLHFGQVGKRYGLWLVADRNGGASTNQVFFMAADRLQAVRPGQDVVVSEAIPIRPPSGGWERFAQSHRGIGADVMADLRTQFNGGGRGAVLDLEGITAGRGVGNEPDLRLFVLAEEPNSLVLELKLEEHDGRAEAVLVDCSAYPEGAGARGSDANDGLEGIAWSGRPGEFYLAEEGTAPHNPSDTLHFWLDPRLTRCRIEGGRVTPIEPWSGEATNNVRALRKGSSETLNALTRWDDQLLLAVDRNGGRILAVEMRSARVWPYLDLYDPALLNLRQRLAQLPGPRRMPYVSIEGIARDASGDLWLVDDPAMPEPFRASCLVRVRNPPPPVPPSLPGKQTR